LRREYGRQSALVRGVLDRDYAIYSSQLGGLRRDGCGVSGKHSDDNFGSRKCSGAGHGPRRGNIELPGVMFGYD
jgi:hypothetical protein